MNLLTHRETGERFEWDGKAFGPVPRTGDDDRFEFDGKEWRPCDGDHSRRFNWDSGIQGMRHWHGDHSKSMRLMGDTICPVSESDYGYRISGHALRSRSNDSPDWAISGNIPREVLCGFIASIIGPRERGGGEGGSGGGGVDLGRFRPLQAPDPWVVATSKDRVKLVIGCQEGHDWEVIPKAPESKPCQICKGTIAPGSTAYTQGCMHSRETFMCSSCMVRFKGYTNKPVANGLIDYSLGGAERFLMPRQTKCCECRDPCRDGKGYHDPKQEKFYCTKCVGVKKGGFAYLMKSLCG